MGLLIEVYRSPFGDCTNGGVSSRSTTLCVVNAEGPFNPKEDTPAVLLERHHDNLLRIVPAVKQSGVWLRVPGWWMMGGNYGATSDSRFSQACEKLVGYHFYGAVAIHDRQE